MQERTEDRGPSPGCAVSRHCRPKRIVHIQKVVGIAGSERHLLALLPRLDWRRFAVEFLALTEPGRIPAGYLKSLTDLGVPARPIPIRGDFDPLCLMALWQHLRRVRPDVVHTHLIHADLYGSLAARLAGVPWVVSTKHNDDAFRQNRLLGPVIRAANRRCDRVIAISRHLADFLARVEGVPVDRITAIHYGLEPPEPDRAARARIRRELGAEDATPLVVTVGRLTEQKGHRYLLEAWRRVRQEASEAVLIVVGDGPLRESLRAAARRLGIADRVVWAGWRDDVPAVMEAADLYVHPSLWEGFGLVLLEAMAAGRCVVASAVSAIPEIVANGETGWLVPPRDDEALADAILRLLKDGATRQAMGEAGRRRVQEHFDVQRMVRATEAVYADLSG